VVYRPGAAGGCDIFSALDIKTYAMAVLKKDYRKSTKGGMPKHWFDSLRNARAVEKYEHHEIPTLTDGQARDCDRHPPLHEPRSCGGSSRRLGCSKDAITLESISVAIVSEINAWFAGRQLRF